MLIYIFSFVVLLSNNRVFLFSGPLYVPADMSVELQIVPASFAKGVLVFSMIIKLVDCLVLT